MINISDILTYTRRLFGWYFHIVYVFRALADELRTEPTPPDAKLPGL